MPKQLRKMLTNWALFSVKTSAFGNHPIPRPGFYVTETRLSKLKESLSSVLEGTDNASAKFLAWITGRIISTSKAIGAAIYLHTRHIVGRHPRTPSQSWDAIIPCSSKVREELQFWDAKVGKLNGKKLFDKPHVFESVVYSDAWEQGFGGYVVSAKYNLVCQGQWPAMKGERALLGESWKPYTICYCPLDKPLGDIKYNGILIIRTSFLLLTEGARNLIFNHWLKTLSICVPKITLWLSQFGYPESRTSWPITSGNLQMCCIYEIIHILYCGHRWN